jgi:hypothetical protein
MHAHILQDNRARPLVWLFGSAAAQFIAFWYPLYVERRNPSPDGDSRYFISPEVVIGAGVVAVAAAFFLLRRLSGHSRLSITVVFLFACMAGVTELFPACLLLWRIFVG